MPQGEAYWISPHGKAIRVSTNHIRAVIGNPESYGYTKEKIEKIYKNHGEKVGTEGDAREEIVLDLVRRGWIRMRQYLGRSDYIALNVRDLGTKTIDRVTDFFEGWKGSKDSKFATVVIASNLKTIRTTVAKILNLSLYKTLAEGKRKREKTITEWVDESEVQVEKKRGVSVLPINLPVVNESVQQVIEEGGWNKAKVILEGSLSRIVRHFAGGKPDKLDNAIKIDPDAHFAILSSYRYPEGAKGDNDLRKELSAYSSSPLGKKTLPRHLQNLRSGKSPTQKFNEASYRRLLNDIRNAGYGAIRLSGLWAAAGQAIPYERSVMIVGQRRGERGPKKMTKQWVTDLAKKYNQDGFIYMGPETKGEHAGRAILYGLDRETGKYEFEMSWRLAKTLSADQIKKRLEQMREAVRNHTEDQYEQWGVTIPKGSGKPSNFEDQPGLKRTQRTGFIFDEPKPSEKKDDSEQVAESITFAFWTELLYEGESYNAMRINSTLFHDPFVTDDEENYIGGQNRY